MTARKTAPAGADPRGTRRRRTAARRHMIRARPATSAEEP